MSHLERKNTSHIRTIAGKILPISVLGCVLFAVANALGAESASEDAQRQTRINDEIALKRAERAAAVAQQGPSLLTSNGIPVRDEILLIGERTPQPVEPIYRAAQESKNRSITFSLLGCALLLGAGGSRAISAVQQARAARTHGEMDNLDHLLNPDKTPEHTRNAQISREHYIGYHPVQGGIELDPSVDVIPPPTTTTYTGSTHHESTPFEQILHRPYKPTMLERFGVWYRANTASQRERASTSYDPYARYSNTELPPIERDVPELQLA